MMCQIMNAFLYLSYYKQMQVEGRSVQYGKVF